MTHDPSVCKHIYFGLEPYEGHPMHSFEHQPWVWRRDVLDWCNERFGPRQHYYGMSLPRWEYSRDGSTVYIRDDNDAFEFRMRWC